MSRTSKKDTLNELESKINGLERSNFDLKLRLHYLNSKYGHMENNDSRNGGYGEYDLREEIQSLTEENEYYKKKIVDLETEVLRLQVAREKEAEKYQEALRMKPAAFQQAEEQRKREREVSQAIAEHDAALIAKLQEELQQLHTERAGHQMLVSDLNDKINKLVQLADDKDTEIDSLVKTVRDMRATIDALTVEQQKLTNLADAASRPIVVTTNTSGQQTSVTLNAATTVNTSSLAQTQAQAALPPFPHANSTYNSKFHGYSSAYSQQFPSTSSVGVHPGGQSIAVTQQSMGPQQSTVSVTATPGRPSLAGATTSNVTISSSMNDATSRYTSSSYRPSSTALPLGAVRGASTTAGLQHTLNNTVLPANTPAHSSLPHHYSQYPSAAIDESVNQSLHASTLMAPATNAQHVSFAHTQSQPQAMTFMSSLPDGSPVRTTVSTSQPHPQHTVVNVSSVPAAAPSAHNASAMQEQFQLSMQQASLDALSYSRNDATMRPAAGAAAATTTTTTTTTLTNVNGGVTATVAQQNVANPAVVDTSYVVHDPATGQPYQHHIQIQQQQQQQAPYDPAQSRMEALQQSIYTTEQVIQRLRHNAHELSLLDKEEVVRLEHELHKSQLEKDQLKHTAQGPPAQSQGKGMMSLHELNQPQRYGAAASSYETNQPPPLYDVPTSSPLRSTRSTSRYAHSYHPTTTVSVTSTPGAPSQPLSSSALGHSYHRTSLAPPTASMSSYRNDLVAATPLPVTTTVTTTTALPDAAVVGAASARGSDVTAYERTIDMYKARENELLSALEGVVKRVQQLEDDDDAPSVDHHAQRSHHHRPSSSSSSRSAHRHEYYAQGSEEDDYSYTDSGRHHDAHHRHASRPSSHHHHHGGGGSSSSSSRRAYDESPSHHPHHHSSSSRGHPSSSSSSQQQQRPTSSASPGRRRPAASSAAPSSNTATYHAAAHAASSRRR
eukprot:gene1734-1255_t